VLHVLSGTPGGKYRFEERIKQICGEDVIVRSGLGSDMYMFHQLLQKDKPDLILGNTYCKYIARDMDIPLLRTGFPIYDRVGHSYQPILGYRGGMNLLVSILNILMDRIDRDAEESEVELVM
jgi:nitrogenase molybdenum-iron protein beta chain